MDARVVQSRDRVYATATPKQESRTSSFARNNVLPLLANYFCGNNNKIQYLYSAIITWCSMALYSIIINLQIN